ncbi:hypothetical protein Tco_0248468 [Tanacetum coccineum]
MIPFMPNPYNQCLHFTQNAFLTTSVHDNTTNSSCTTQPNSFSSTQILSSHKTFSTSTVPNSHYLCHNAKFPYLEKEKYEIWAMKMKYWIQNADHNLWRIVQQGNSPKRLGKDAKGNTIVHPPVSLDEHVAVQRENKFKARFEEEATQGYDSSEIPEIIDAQKNTTGEVCEAEFCYDGEFSKKPSVFTQTLLRRRFKLFNLNVCQAGEMHAFPPYNWNLLCPAYTKSTLRKHRASLQTLRTHASCDSSLKTQPKDIPPAVDIQLSKSDVKTQKSTTGSPIFSSSIQSLGKTKAPSVPWSVRGIRQHLYPALVRIGLGLSSELRLVCNEIGNAEIQKSNAEAEIRIKGVLLWCIYKAVPSADSDPAGADESTLPPGQQLGTSENTTRFPVPSDVCMDQLTSGIFTSSSYDDDFRATLTNLAPAVEKQSSTNPSLVKVHSLDMFQNSTNESNSKQTKLHCLIKGKPEEIVVRNKARLVHRTPTKGGQLLMMRYFAPVARIEAIRLFFAIASYMGIVCIITEWFKALYGLQPAPQPGNARLSTFRVTTTITESTIDKTLHQERFQVLHGDSKSTTVDVNFCGKVNFMAVQKADYCWLLSSLMCTDRSIQLQCTLFLLKVGFSADRTMFCWKYLSCWTLFSSSCSIYPPARTELFLLVSQWFCCSYLISGCDELVLLITYVIVPALLMDNAAVSRFHA